MNKQDIKRHFKSGDVPTEAQFAEWIERCVIWIDDAAELPDACSALAGTCYLVAGKVVVRCENSVEGWKWVPKGNGGSGTTSYPELTDKPKINRVVLSGSMTHADLGIMPDFPELWSGPVLDDATLIVVGNGGRGYKTTLGRLKEYLAVSPATGGCRLPIRFDGEQDGSNRDFATRRAYVPGTSALYLNGQRLYPEEDYTETGTSAFKLTKAPEQGDRILFEAVAAEDIRQTQTT